MNALLLFLLLQADSEGVRSIVVDKTKLLELRTSPNVVTSVAFERSFKLDDLICGNDAALTKKLSGNGRQLNLSPAAKVAAKTRSNCNLTFEDGERIAFLIEVVEKNPDLFVEVSLPASQVNTQARQARPAKPSCPREELDQAAFDASEKARSAQWQDFAGQAARGIVYTKLRKRENANDIIFALHEYVRLGNRAFVRFSIQNRTSQPWQPSHAEVHFYKSGQRAEMLTDGFGVSYADEGRSTGLIIGPGDEIYGAITFRTVGFAPDSKFRFQVFESQGTRHPLLEGVEF